jgi:hypothetical protein
VEVKRKAPAHKKAPLKGKSNKANSVQKSKIPVSSQKKLPAKVKSNKITEKSKHRVPSPSPKKVEIPTKVAADAKKPKIPFQSAK